MGSLPAVWLNGERATALPLPDRGIDYGDGLFETLLLRQGVPVLLDYHLQRLQTGLDRLAFPRNCLTQASDHLRHACSEMGDHQWSVLKLTLTRGSGPRGYAPPDHSLPRTLISAQPLDYRHAEMAPPLQVGMASMNWAVQPFLSGIKHLNRLEQVLAANEARTQAVDDVVVLDARGHVCALSAANLFLVEDGRLLTPALEDVGILGTRRRLVIERLAPAAGLDVSEQVVHPEQLHNASELFCCNAVRGLQPIAQLGQSQWQTYPVCEALHAHYARSIA